MEEYTRTPFNPLSSDSFTDYNAVPLERKGEDLASEAASEMTERMGNIFVRFVSSILNKLTSGRVPQRLLGVRLRSTDSLDLMKKDFKLALSLSSSAEGKVLRESKGWEKALKDKKAGFDKQIRELDKTINNFTKAAEKLSEENEDGAVKQRETYSNQAENLIAKKEDLETFSKTLGKQLELIHKKQGNIRALKKDGFPKLGKGNESNDLFVYLTALSDELKSLDELGLEADLLIKTIDNPNTDDDWGELIDEEGSFTDEEDSFEFEAPFVGPSSSSFEGVQSRKITDHENLSLGTLEKKDPRYTQANLDFFSKKKEFRKEIHPYLEPAFIYQDLASQDRDSAIQGIVQRRQVFQQKLNDFSKQHLAKNSNDYAYLTRVHLTQEASKIQDSRLTEDDSVEGLSYKDLTKIEKKERLEQKSIESQASKWLNRILGKPEKIHTPEEQAAVIWNASLEERKEFLTHIEGTLGDLSQQIKDINDTLATVNENGLESIPRDYLKDTALAQLKQLHKQLEQTYNTAIATEGGANYRDLKDLQKAHNKVSVGLEDICACFVELNMPPFIGEQVKKTQVQITNRQISLEKSPLLQPETFQILEKAQDCLTVPRMSEYVEFNKGIQKKCDAIFGDLEALPENRKTRAQRKIVKQILEGQKKFTNKHRAVLQNRASNPKEVQAFKADFKKYRSRQTKLMGKLPTTEKRVKTLAVQTKNLRATLEQIEEAANFILSEENKDKSTLGAKASARLVLNKVQHLKTTGTPEAYKELQTAFNSLLSKTIPPETNKKVKIGRKKVDLAAALEANKDQAKQLSRLNTVLKTEVLSEVRSAYNQEREALASEYTELASRCNSLRSEYNAILFTYEDDKEILDINLPPLGKKIELFQKAIDLSKEGIDALDREHASVSNNLIYQSSKKMQQYLKNPAKTSLGKSQSFSKMREVTQKRVEKTGIYKGPEFKSRKKAAERCRGLMEKVDQKVFDHNASLAEKLKNAESSNDSIRARELRQMQSELHMLVENSKVPKKIDQHNVRELSVEGRIRLYEGQVDRLMQTHKARLDQLNDAVLADAEFLDKKFAELDSINFVQNNATKERDQALNKIREIANKANRNKTTQEGLTILDELNALLNERKQAFGTFGEESILHDLGNSNIVFRRMAESRLQTIRETHKAYLASPEGRELNKQLRLLETSSEQIVEAREARFRLGGFLVTSLQRNVAGPLLQVVEKITNDLNKTQKENGPCLKSHSILTLRLEIHKKIAFIKNLNQNNISRSEYREAEAVARELLQKDAEVRLRLFEEPEKTTQEELDELLEILESSVDTIKSEGKIEDLCLGTIYKEFSPLLNLTDKNADLDKKLATWGPEVQALRTSFEKILGKDFCELLPSKQQEALKNLSLEEKKALIKDLSSSVIPFYSKVDSPLRKQARNAIEALEGYTSKEEILKATLCQNACSNLTSKYATELEKQKAGLKDLLGYFFDYGKDRYGVDISVDFEDLTEDVTDQLTDEDFSNLKKDKELFESTITAITVLEESIEKLSEISQNFSSNIFIDSEEAPQAQGEIEIAEIALENVKKQRADLEDLDFLSSINEKQIAQEELKVLKDELDLLQLEIDHLIKNGFNAKIDPEATGLSDALLNVRDEEEEFNGKTLIDFQEKVSEIQENTKNLLEHLEKTSFTQISQEERSKFLGTINLCSKERSELSEELEAWKSEAIQTRQNQQQLIPLYNAFVQSTLSIKDAIKQFSAYIPSNIITETQSVIDENFKTLTKKDPNLSIFTLEEIEDLSEEINSKKDNLTQQKSIINEYLSEQKFFTSEGEQIEGTAFKDYLGELDFKLFSAKYVATTGNTEQLAFQKVTDVQTLEFFHVDSSSESTPPHAIRKTLQLVEGTDGMGRKGSFLIDEEKKLLGTTCKEISSLSNNVSELGEETVFLKTTCTDLSGQIYYQVVINLVREEDGTHPQVILNPCDSNGEAFEDKDSIENQDFVFKILSGVNVSPERKSLDYVLSKIQPLPTEDTEARKERKEFDFSDLEDLFQDLLPKDTNRGETTFKKELEDIDALVLNFKEDLSKLEEIEEPEELEEVVTINIGTVYLNSKEDLGELEEIEESVTLDYGNVILNNKKDSSELEEIKESDGDDGDDGDD